jgi:hypothetical protein
MENNKNKLSRRGEKKKCVKRTEKHVDTNVLSLYVILLFFLLEMK